MIKRAYLGFTSDIYLFLETVGGQVTVCKYIFYFACKRIFKHDLKF